MNVLAAPLLFVMPEPDAFYCFRRLCTEIAPMYVRQNLEGVHAGVTLCDRTLRLIDPELAGHLEAKRLTPAIWSFASLLTFLASSPPLGQLLRVWDFLVAFGFHNAVYLTVAQLSRPEIRAQLIASDRPHLIVSGRAMPPLDADALIAETASIIRRLPDSLRRAVAAHACDLEGCTDFLPDHLRKAVRADPAPTLASAARMVSDSPVSSDSFPAVNGL
jgi:cell cycle arrest protein BUB2